MKILYKEVISQKGYDLLKNIQSNKVLKNFYLVGGTALALQLGHRKSCDLDLFSQQGFKNSIVNNIDVDYKVISLHDNSIELEIQSSKVFFFYFAFPLYKKLLNIKGIRLADPVDIGLMKLLSLQGRTVRKDIIDLYFLDKEVMKLSNLLEIFEKHYPKESFNSYDSLKTLIDPKVLEDQPMPEMLKRCSWKKCLSLVQERVRTHLKKVAKIK